MVEDIKEHQQGQSTLEYALIIVLVALIVIGAMLLFGEEITSVFCKVSEALGFGFCANETAAYCEEPFDDNSQWEFTRDGEDYWQVADGQMCMTRDSFRNYAYSTCSQNLSSDDYEIHLNSASLTQGPGYGVFFRLQDTSDKPSGYIFQYDAGAGGFVFRKWTEGSERTIAYQRDKDYGFYDSPRDIKIKVEGDTFSAYIDGELILTATDSTYPSGDSGVGFRTWWDTRVCFDDLLIEPIAED